MRVTAVILTNTLDRQKYEMTTNAINSLISSDGWNGEIILVETQNVQHLIDNNFYYENVKIVLPNERFNYNRFLNIAISMKEDSSDWIMVCNNDIIFGNEWFKIVETFTENHPEVLSLSPVSPGWEHHIGKPFSGHELGYKVSEHVCGWCLLFKYEEVYKKLKLFDEQFEFYYQDDDYSKTLELNNIPHALLFDSKVRHLVSSSKDLIAGDMYRYWTLQGERFNRKWNV